MDDMRLARAADSEPDRNLQFDRRWGEGVATGPDAPAEPAHGLPLTLPPLVDSAGPDRLSKLQIELRHVNPPPGAQMTVTSQDPSQIDVTGPRVMGAMPGSGAQRNVARDGR